MKIIHLIILLLSIQIQVFSTCISVGSGDWGDPNTWICNGVPGVPGCGDTITIAAGHTVSVRNHQDYSEPSCSTPIFVIVDGILDFPVNGPKLRLPCNSGFIINSGGSLSSSAPAGGGSSNFLEICSTVYWRKADGTITGPIIYGAPLPIEITEFDGHADGDVNKIYWVTASEINNDYFILEKSDNGIHWSELERKKGAGNSSTPIFYEYTDVDPFIMTTYYRLSQVDFDGASETFKMIAVKNESKVFYTYYKNDDNNIYLSSPEYFELYNMMGQIVVSGNGTNVETYGLNQGIYILKIGTYTHKFFLR